MARRRVRLVEWHEQPPQPVALGGGDALAGVAQSSVRAISGDCPVDLATGARPVQDGLPRVSYPGGIGAQFAASASQRIEFASPISSGDVTLVSVFAASGSGTRVICGVFNNAGSAVGHYVDIEGGLLTAVSTDAGNWAVLNGPAITNGAVYRAVVVFRSGVGRRMFLNGALVAQSSVARSPTGISQFVVGVYNGGSGAYSSPFSGVVGDAYMIPSALSDAEAAALSANPWQLFEPQRIWVPVSAGTSGRTGSLSETLGALTSSATGTVLISGTASKTLGTLTSSATGTVALTGTLSKTLGTLTLAADGAGATVRTGELTKTFGALTSSATGTVAITGAVSKTLGALSLSAAGFSGGAISGELAATLGGLALSAQGGNGLTGRRGRRTKTRFLPPAEPEVQETPKETTGLVSEEAMTLLIQEQAGKAIRKARVSATKRRLEIQSHNVKALESTLMEWF